MGNSTPLSSTKQPGGDMDMAGERAPHPVTLCHMWVHKHHLNPVAMHPQFHFSQLVPRTPAHPRGAGGPCS